MYTSRHLHTLHLSATRAGLSTRSDRRGLLLVLPVGECYLKGRVSVLGGFQEGAENMALPLAWASRQWFGEPKMAVQLLNYCAVPGIALYV